MKLFPKSKMHLHSGRAPQGARGLKLLLKLGLILMVLSRPARGAWVEIEKF